MENKVDEGCILAVKAARDVIGDYCDGTCTEVTDMFTLLAATLSTSDSTFAIASNEELSRDERVSELIEHQQIMSAVEGITSWDREKTTQLIAILLVFFAEARISKESATNALKK
jgi:hypothetical protein